MNSSLIIAMVFVLFAGFAITKFRRDFNALLEMRIGGIRSKISRDLLAIEDAQARLVAAQNYYEDSLAYTHDMREQVKQRIEEYREKSFKNLEKQIALKELVAQKSIEQERIKLEQKIHGKIVDLAVQSLYDDTFSNDFEHQILNMLYSNELFQNHMVDKTFKG